MGNYNKLLKPIETFFSELVSRPELYLQLALAGSVLILAVISSHYVKKSISHISAKNEAAKNFLQGSLRFVTPFFAALFLTIATLLSEQVFKDSSVISHIAKLSRFWLILNLVWRLSQNKSVGRLIIIMLVPLLLLRILGLFDPTVSYLDSLDFTIGKFRLSAYIVIKGIIVLTILLWFTGILSRTGDQYIRRVSSIGFNTKELLIKFFDITLYGIVFLVTLNIMGVDLTALAVFGGALGVGIGFGLQKITSNFISGIILLAEKSIKADDLVEIQGVTGFVKRLGARSVVMESTDGREILIPNEDFITSKVTNWTYSNTRGRAEIQIGISYDSDLVKARRLMIEAAMESPDCLEEPPPECYVTEFADNATKLMLYFWIENISKGRGRPKSDVMTAIWQKFGENNIKIPVTSAAIGNIQGAPK